VILIKLDQLDDFGNIECSALDKFGKDGGSSVKVHSEGHVLARVHALGYDGLFSNVGRLLFTYHVRDSEVIVQCTGFLNAQNLDH